MKTRFIFNLLSLSLAIALSSCATTGSASSLSSKPSSTSQVSSGLTIHKDAEFGGICIDTSIVDFMKDGYQFGDSFNIEFSNGVSYQDIPFYDGYYVKTGDILLIGYPGYEYLELCKNNTSGFYDSFNFPENTTVQITLNTAQKYKTTQEALGLKYSDDRNTYASDQIFANYRNVKYGRIGKNVLYRGASPVNNVHNRASYVDEFIEKDKVAYIIDLADSEDNMKSYLADPNFKSDYAKTLYNKGKVDFLGLNMGYTADSYGQTIAVACRKMLNNDGPYYFHCTEGKDRTGFFAIVLEALMGATDEQLEEDYMITYNNYYGVNKTDTPDLYQAIVDLRFSEFVDFFCLEAAVGTLTLEAKAYNYLKRSGLTDAELEDLKELLATDIEHSEEVELPFI
ncbi:MAG: tyrosine-protein phosphatase [Bacilli bacterium]|nr:tyrosine-protein phosphatase [Bacilli bacterium]